MSMLFLLVFNAIFLVLNLTELFTRLVLHSEHDFWFWSNVVFTVCFGVTTLLRAREYLGGAR